jgi:hypothetical protein
MSRCDRAVRDRSRPGRRPAGPSAAGWRLHSGCAADEPVVGRREGGAVWPGHRGAAAGVGAVVRGEGDDRDHQQDQRPQQLGVGHRHRQAAQPYLRRRWGVLGLRCDRNPAPDRHPRRGTARADPPQHHRVPAALHRRARAAAADRLWVPRTVPPHATCRYSWRRPPRRSRRSTWMAAPEGSRSVVHGWVLVQ